MNEINELKVLKRKRNILLPFIAALFLSFLTCLNIISKLDDGTISLILLLSCLFIYIVLLYIITSKLTKCLNEIKRIRGLISLPTDYTEVTLLNANNIFDKECRKGVSSILIKRGSTEDIDIIYTLNDEVRYLSVSLEESKKFLNLIPFSIL